MTRPDLTTALRSLDAADQRVDATSPRARADLRAILASDPFADAPAPSRAVPSPAAPAPAPPAHPASGTAPAPAAPAPARSPRRPVRTRRVALLAGAAAVLAGGMVVLPSLTGGDRAYATWTGEPGALSAQERASAVEECRSSAGAVDPGSGEDLRTARDVVAERRGAWTTVVLAGSDGFAALCVTDDSALVGGGRIGSVGRADVPEPGPRDLVATSLGWGATSAGALSLAAGTAGPEVVGVRYRSPEHGDVAATVAEGHFAFWVPGAEMDDPSGVDVEVTYRDGTTGTVRLTL